MNASKCNQIMNKDHYNSNPNNIIHHNLKDLEGIQLKWQSSICRCKYKHLHRNNKINKSLFYQHKPKELIIF